MKKLSLAKKIAYLTEFSHQFSKKIYSYLYYGSTTKLLKTTSALQRKSRVQIHLSEPSLQLVNN